MFTDTLHFNLSENNGKFKILNATNGGPWHNRHVNDQWRSNFDDYKKAGIPYSRNHDSNLAGSVYGGPYAHDISTIFPNFNADPYNPGSYDFACTDESILTALDAGTETFFRLGQTIEHQIKKHATLPPADFKKWAIICERIIRHYNEGWADGYKLNIEYWEIWNEPDLDPDDSQNKRTWGGTKAEFFHLFEITAKHLKSCFPNLKIGGPALAHNLVWAKEFLTEMQKRSVPIDFFSWHIYCTNPESMLKRAEFVRNLLDENGYEKTESILNEWNYVKGWEADFIYSVETIIGMKGAAFTMACISEAQHSSIDMLMYYDTRPSAFCGAFDYYTYRPLKGYYPLYWYGMMYDMQKEIPSENKIENIYSLCGTDRNSKITAIITYYCDDDTADEKEIAIDFKKAGKYEVYLVDDEHNGELLTTTDRLTFNMKRNSIFLIKEV